MDEYLTLCLKMNREVEVRLPGIVLMGEVEKESDGGLFHVQGWWFAPEHVIAVRAVWRTA